ncbi:MAG: nickel-dependent lactate racemase [Pyrinomonadaceae bacterium]
MQKIRLKYGSEQIPFEYDENFFNVLGNEKQKTALTDAEIGARLDNPIDSPTLEEIILPDETVLIVVPDATRSVAAGQIVNLLVRRLIAGGTNPSNITIIFATGIHRAVTEAEKRAILTPFIAQRIKTLNHDARDLAALRRFGETQRGIPVELNRAVAEYNRIIIVGGVNFHYFAGFSGGRKMICPGLGSSRTINETHKLAFDCERKTRRAGVGAGLLKGNAVHEEFIEIVEKINPSFVVNSIVNEQGAATEIFAGNWKTAHEQACDFYAAKHTVKIAEKRDVVIVSGGGAPFDLNMIQAHKALDTAASACTSGGTIIFLAKCADGLGRSDFLKWFEAEDSGKLVDVLCEKYQVNGQTAWSLLRKAEKFNVQILTTLGENETRRMRLHKLSDFKTAVSKIAARTSGYILPFGAKFLIKNASEI